MKIVVRSFFRLDTNTTLILYMILKGVFRTNLHLKLAFKEESLVLGSNLRFVFI